MLRRIQDWIEDRTGLASAIKSILNNEIPASAGWPHVFGSVALFAFLTQVFSGILLSFNYAPAPGDAYNSVRYIVSEVTAGRLMRGLHRWGANLMLVVVVLHMIQTFLWGAYKKPREATWVAGVVLLLLTLAYGFSGYLLPWDNRAYWTTLEHVRILGAAPGIGPILLRLLGADGATIGTVTFTRYYVVHVLLLPPLTMLSIAAHVYLARRHGTAPVPGDEGRPRQKFYPEQVRKDTIAIFGWFVILFVMAIFARVPLGHLADPTDFSYVPRPAWYSLFLFPFLKRFEGPLEIVGSVVIPMLTVVAISLVPFVDRAKMTLVRRRVGAFAVVSLAVLGWTALTVQTTIRTRATRETDMALVRSWQEIPADDLAAIGYLRDANCASCHPLGTPGAGPDLMPSSTRPLEWLQSHVRQPAQNAPATGLTEPQAQILAAFLVRRSDKAIDAWQTAPQRAIEGAKLYASSDCGQCHRLNGSGDELGPPLNGVGERQSKAWIKESLLDPQKLVKDSIMPAYSFSPGDMDLIADYIMAIPK